MPGDWQSSTPRSTPRRQNVPKNKSWIVALAVVFALLVPVGVAMAQSVVTEKAEFEVMRLLHNRHTVILKNLGTGEYVKYDKIPDGVTIYVNDQPAKISALKRGMKLTALRIENAPAAVKITQSEMEAEEKADAAEVAAAAPASEPAPAAAPAAAAPAAAAPAEKPATLPSTATHQPLVGLGGAALLLFGIVAGGLRRRLS